MKQCLGFRINNSFDFSSDEQVKSDATHFDGRNGFLVDDIPLRFL
jgi:hypothetical protein